MSTKFKLNGKAATNALYIGAAILVVAIICVSIALAANQSRKPSGGKLPLATSASGTSGENNVKPAPTTTAAKEPSSTPTTSDSVNTGVNTPTKLTFSEPLESGFVIKGHSEDLFVYSVTMNDYRIHTGIDILANVGDSVFSVADGKVKQIYNDALMGTCVAIEHDGGIVSYYMNLAETVADGITEGSEVSCGQLIGSVGESAIIEISDEPHLHFEMKKDGLSVDPLEFVSYEAKSEE